MESFQIIWVIGVRPNLITWVEGEERILSAKKKKEKFLSNLAKKRRA